MPRLGVTRGALVPLFVLMSVAGCGTMAHVATEPVGDSGITAADPLAVQLRLSVEALELTIINRGTTPLEVLWDKSSVVSTDGRPSAIVHSEGSAWDSPDANAFTVSRIMPYMPLHTFLVPMRDVSYTPGEGWLVSPMLPVECGPMRCVGYHELVGQTVHLTLVMRIDGAERTFEWTLRITRAERSVRGNRPKDPDLH